MLWPSTPSGTRGTASPAGWRGTSRRMLSVKPCSDHTGWSSSDHTLTLHLTFDRPRDGGTKFVISSPLTLSEFENEVVGPNVFRNTRQPANYQVMRGWWLVGSLILDWSLTTAAWCGRGGVRDLWRDPALQGEEKVSSRLRQEEERGGGALGGEQNQETVGDTGPQHWSCQVGWSGSSSVCHRHNRQDGPEISGTAELGFLPAESPVISQPSEAGEEDWRLHHGQREVSLQAQTQQSLLWQEEETG